MSNLETRFLTSPDELEAVAAAWHRLWASDPAQEAFTAPGWSRAVWQNYAAGRELRAVAVLCRDELVGLLPLARRGRVLEFISSPHSDYNDILCVPGDAPAVLAAALEAVFSRSAEWSECALLGVVEDSVLARTLPLLGPELASRAHLSFRGVCPQVDRTLDPGVLAALLKKKSLRRHENAIQRMGELRFRHLEDRQEIDGHLDRFFEQHIGRRALEADASQFHDEAQRGLYRSLVRELDPRNHLRFGVLDLDGKPIAYHLGFEAHGRFLWYKPTFDAELAKFSPGEVLLKRLLEYVGERGHTVFDFTIGDEAFKSRFANRVRQCHSLHLHPTGIRGGVRRLAIRLKDMAKSNEALTRIRRRLGQ